MPYIDYEKVDLKTAASSIEAAVFLLFSLEQSFYPMCVLHGNDAKLAIPGKNRI